MLQPTYNTNRPAMSSIITCKRVSHALLCCTMLISLPVHLQAQKVNKAHDELAKYVEKNGGKVCGNTFLDLLALRVINHAHAPSTQIGFRVGKPCGYFATCPRGCLATQSYKVCVRGVGGHQLRSQMTSHSLVPCKAPHPPPSTGG